MDYPRLNPSVLKNPTLASTFYDQLQEAINRELEQLGKMEQLAVYYQGPSGAPLLVTDLGYHNPYLIKLRSPKRTIGFVGQSSKRTSADHAP